MYMTALRALAVTIMTAIPAAAAQDDFENRVRAYILANPEIIVEALAILSERERKADVAALVAKHPHLFTEPAYHGLGAGDAPIRVVEFFDYKCAPCKTLHHALVPAIAANPDIYVEMRHLPILSPASERAARFALSVRHVSDADTYARIHDRLWAARGPMNAALFERLATSEGLDFAALEAAMYSAWVSDRIEANRDTAIALEILGTPAFVTRSSVRFGAADVDDLIKDWRGD